MASFNIDIPNINSETLTNPQILNKVMNYLALLTEQLRYNLNNIGLEDMDKDATAFFKTLTNSITGITTEISNLNGEINLKVSSDDVENMINISISGIHLNANQISLEGLTTINGKFSIDSYGNAYLRGGELNISNSYLGVNTTLKISKDGLEFKAMEGSATVGSVLIGLVNSMNSTFGLKTNAVYASAIGPDSTNLMSLISGKWSASRIDAWTALYESGVAISSKYASSSHAHGTLYAQSNPSGISAYFSSSGNFVSTNAGTLGTSTNYWAGAFLGSGPMVVSDKNKKNSIQNLNEKYDALLMKLIAVTFKYDDGTSDRTHAGFTAQDVENAMYEVGLSTYEFAGFVKAPRYRLDENGEEDRASASNIVGYDYSLRYEEFIPILTSAVQKHQTKIDQLEDIVASQQETINDLLQRVSALEGK